MTPGARNRFPLLGGPISAALLYLSFAGKAPSTLAWFSLVPFLQSLDRHRAHVWLRLAHGFSLGCIAGAAVGRGDLTPILLGFFSAAFAGFAGPLLRSRGALVPAAGLPLLWTGIEVLRGPMSPFPGALADGWIALGSALPPDSLEAQAAAILGVHGLSFALSAAAALFTLALRERSFLSQCLLAAAGCALPLACRASGHLRSSALDAGDRLTVAVVAEPAAGAERLIALSRPLGGGGAAAPEIILWPLAPVGTMDDGALGRIHVDPDAVERFARESGARVIAAAEDFLRDPSRIAAIQLDPDGRLSAAYASSGSRVGVFASPRGRIGIGVGSDFDSPALARREAANGAGLLVLLTLDRGALSETARRHRSALERYRAVENGRWLLRSGAAAAFVADPRGRLAFRVEGASAAGTCSVEWLAATTFYTRAGWWIEPACLAAACAILACGVAGAVARRRSESRLAGGPAATGSTGVTGASRGG